MSTGNKDYDLLKGLSYGFRGGPFFDVAAKAHVKFEELKHGHNGQPFVGSRKVDNAYVTFTDAADVISATATLVSSAYVAFTDDADTISADAVVVDVGVIASVSFTDDADTIVADATIATSAYVVITDDADTIVADATIASHADASVVDEDDTIIATATVTGGDAPPVIPTGVHGGGSSSRRPYRSQFTTTYLAGDAHVTRYARLKVILDGVTCKAYAQVGHNERARTKRRAAIAMLIG